MLEYIFLLFPSTRRRCLASVLDNVTTRRICIKFETLISSLTSSADKRLLITLLALECHIWLPYINQSLLWEARHSPLLSYGWTPLQIHQKAKIITTKTCLERFSKSHNCIQPASLQIKIQHFSCQKRSSVTIMEL
jgi:hypothetical protein